MDIVDVDNIIVGAGVIGLAIGAELARNGQEVFVLECANAIGTGISSRNSEVIHSGIYYPTGSLMQNCCIEGRQLIYNYCRDHKIPFRNCGKLVVATSTTEISVLEKLAKQAIDNGITRVELIDGKKAHNLEPELASIAALHVPDTGIFDSHSYMMALSTEIEEGNGSVLLGHRVGNIHRYKSGFEIEVATVSDRFKIRTRRLVLAAGLWSHEIAARVEGYDISLIPSLNLAKGSYFSCKAPAAFSRLIYPVPEEGGLGVHLTLDLNGRMRFGPNVEWLSSSDPAAIDYKVEPELLSSFYTQIRRYWPRITRDMLTPGFSGVRPKLTKPAQSRADFLIHGPSTHHIEGFVALFGIESPGLTSSLSIAKHVASELS